MTIQTGCDSQKIESIPDYHRLVNQAELAICENDFNVALAKYDSAFQFIQRSFGADLFNAALAALALENKPTRERYLQELINGSDDVGRLREIFANAGVTETDWEELIGNRTRNYDETLRSEMQKIRDRDQLFRPDCDNYDDTINAIRKDNLVRLISLEKSGEFPSHKEIGYWEDLRRLPHHIVLHHTAQRRSYDKTVVDLEPLLQRAVLMGKLDPELAILYLKFQNDSDKGNYQTLSTWQYQHPLLPEKMNQSIWAPKLSNSEKSEIDELRIAWFADPIADIEKKANYLENSNLPFVFTSVSKSIAKLSNDLTAEEAVEQYLLFTDNMRIID